MAAAEREVMTIRVETDVVVVRQRVRAVMVDLGFGVVDQTKMVTAASELARNALVHGGGGEVHLESIRNGGNVGLRLTFEDRGPGISDVQVAMRDGYTTANGMGLGLGGAKRLVNDFDIVSKRGEGTRVTIARWK